MVNRNFCSIQVYKFPSIPDPLNLHLFLVHPTAEAPKTFHAPKMATPVGFSSEELNQAADERMVMLEHPMPPTPQHILETRQLIDRLNSDPPSASTLMILKNQMESFFHKGPIKASFAMELLRLHAKWKTFAIKDDKVIVGLSSHSPGFDHFYATVLSWYSSTHIARLALLLVAPVDQERLCEPFDSIPVIAGGFDDMAIIRSEPSASLRPAFQTAKAAALGPQASVTVVIVHLVDPHSLENPLNKYYLSYGHAVTLVIGSEGMVVWQSRGRPEAGYLFSEYLESGGGRVRDWKESGDWVEKFEKLITSKVSLRASI